MMREKINAASYRDLLPNNGAGDGRHYWLTPPDLMAKMKGEFAFDFDACPFPCPPDFDGRVANWGKSTYVNPPFTGATAWARKSILERNKGNTVVMVFPLDKWILMLLDAGAEVRNLGDVKWCAIEDGLPGKGMGRWIAQFILRPKT